MREWYALWTRSRQEGLVCRGVESRQIETFLPTIPKWSVWKDRKKKIQWPLFPGYCFARFDREARHHVLNCDGVARIVSAGLDPAPIPDQDIEGIRRLVTTDFVLDPCPLIREGVLVEVVRGPLRGVVGRLVRKGPRHHLVLCVEAVNQAVSVHVEAGDIVAC
jgi:transcription antitermination factor NusG